MNSRSALSLVYIDWTPVPRHPWAVRDVTGRVIKRYDTSLKAWRYAERLRQKHHTGKREG